MKKEQKLSQSKPKSTNFLSSTFDNNNIAYISQNHFINNNNSTYFNSIYNDEFVLLINELSSSIKTYYQQNAVSIHHLKKIVNGFDFGKNEMMKNNFNEMLNKFSNNFSKFFNVAKSTFKKMKIYRYEKIEQFNSNNNNNNENNNNNNNIKRNNSLLNIEREKNDKLKQENLLLKNKYTIPKKKKTDYKKLKKSKRDIYQYRVTQKKENEINISKENRFIIKGKPKKLKKKIKNSIKREVIYSYKSSIIPKKTELSIGGNINNTISPNTASEKIETEGNIMKLISPENSSRGKDEIDINLNQNHIIGVSPAKEEITQKYKSNTFSNSLNINNNENKENIISMDQLKGEKKTYISPRRLRQSNKNKKEEKAKENITIPQKKYNTVDINDKEKYKTDDSKVNSNVYYSTSFRIPKKEKNKTVDNNTMFISARSSSSSQSHYRNDKSDKQNEMKNNMNRISINSSSSSPVVLRNTENSRIKTENENINKINLKPEKEEIKNEVKKEVEENKQTEKKLELNNNASNEPLSMTTSKVKETETNNYNFLVNFNNIDSQELSEYTKAYLNSYMSASRPELSDFSKQFLISTEINESTTKPELSNITRAYLFSQNAPEEGK